MAFKIRLIALLTLYKKIDNIVFEMIYFSRM